MINLDTSARRPCTQFKFLNMSTLHAEFLEVVKKSWDQQVVGTHQYRVLRKLKDLNCELRRFHGTYFPKPIQKEEAIREALAQAQADLANDPSNATLQQNEHLLRDQLLYWRECPIWRKRQRGTGSFIGIGILRIFMQ